jgi:methyl-accepting chemotaxis protein
VESAKSYSLVARITLWAALFIVLFMSISIAIDYRINSNRWYWSIEERAAEIGEFVSLSLPPALWNYEMEAVDRVLISAVNSKVIDGIYVVEKDKFRKGFWKHNNEGVQTQDSLPKDTNLTTLKIYLDDAGVEPIATVYFDINENYVTQQMNVLVSTSIIRALVLCLGLAVATYLLLKWLVRKPILKLGDAMRDIAEGEGDLTQRLSITQNNEIGQLVEHFNRFMNKLQSSMSAVGQVASQAHQTATDLDTSFDISRKLVSEQTLEIDSIATAVTESTAATQDIAENAQATSTAADNAHKDIQKSQVYMESTAKLIQELDSTFQQTLRSMTTLKSDVDAVAEITTIMRGIAEQGEQLARNVAAEAAQTGEKQNGVASIADEVHALAERTREGTQEISAKIDCLISSSEAGAKLFSSGSQASREGVETVGQALGSLRSVNDLIGQINDMSTHIASAVKEQSKVTQELDQNIQRLSVLAQESNSQLDQAGSCNRSLNEQTDSLTSHLEGFKW